MTWTPERRHEYYLKNAARIKARVTARNRVYVKWLQGYVQTLKDAPCLDCGNKFPPYVMDYDHVRGKRTIEVSVAVARGWSVKRVLEEIAKCDLVCTNCHRIRTFQHGRKHRFAQGKFLRRGKTIPHVKWAKIRGKERKEAAELAAKAGWSAELVHKRRKKFYTATE